MKPDQDFKTHLPEQSPQTLPNKQIQVRVFDGNLCETKEEAFQKYKQRQMIEPFSNTLQIRNLESAQSRMSQGIASKRMSNMTDANRKSLRLDDEDEEEGAFSMQIDEINLDAKNFKKARFEDQKPQLQGFNQQRRSKAFSYHHRHKSNQIQKNHLNKTLLSNFPQCIVDNPQEKLLNNRVFHRITHSQHNNKRPLQQIDLSKLQELPVNYEKVFTNKSQYGLNLFKSAYNVSVKEDLEQQRLNSMEMNRNKKEVLQLEKQCLMSIDNHRSSVKNKNQVFFEFLPEDMENVMNNLEKEIRSNMVFKQSMIIKGMENRHIKRMRRFKDQIGHKANNIETFTDVGTRFMRTQEFKKEDKDLYRNKEDQDEEDEHAQEIQGFQGNRKEKIRQHINKYLVSRNYEPLKTEEGDSAQKQISPIKIDFGKKGQILYTQNSLKKLLENDTSKYEESQQAVMDEFQEYQLQSYYHISNRHKNGARRLN